MLRSRVSEAWSRRFAPHGGIRAFDRAWPIVCGSPKRSNRSLATGEPGRLITGGISRTSAGAPWPFVAPRSTNPPVFRRWGVAWGRIDPSRLRSHARSGLASGSNMRPRTQVASFVDLGATFAFRRTASRREPVIAVRGRATTIFIPRVGNALAGVDRAIWAQAPARWVDFVNGKSSARLGGPAIWPPRPA